MDSREWVEITALDDTERVFVTVDEPYLRRTQPFEPDDFMLPEGEPMWRTVYGPRSAPNPGAPLIPVAMMLVCVAMMLLAVFR